MPFIYLLSMLLQYISGGVYMYMYIICSIIRRLPVAISLIRIDDDNIFI